MCGTRVSAVQKSRTKVSVTPYCSVVVHARRRPRRIPRTAESVELYRSIWSLRTTWFGAVIDDSTSSVEYGQVPTCRRVSPFVHIRMTVQPCAHPALMHTRIPHAYAYPVDASPDAHAYP
eukprot:3713591-Rhodomonas_salina.1